MKELKLMMLVFFNMSEEAEKILDEEDTKAGRDIANDLIASGHLELKVGGTESDNADHTQLTEKGKELIQDILKLIP